MANEVRINLAVSGEQVAAQKLEKVEQAAEGAGDAIQEMGGQATVAGKATEAAGDEFREAGQDAGYLSRQVDELTASYKDLIRQLNETGDTSLRKDIRRTRRDLRENERLLKDITPDVVPDVAPAAGAVGGQLVKSIASGISAGGPILAGGKAALAVTAVPALGAAISTAVVGGIGAGGIIGGIALAAQDPQVKSAGAQLGESLLGDFRAAASPFVAPVLQAIGKIGAAGEDMAAGLAPSFAALATKIDPLVDGLLAASEEALPGLADALAAAEPFMDILARELPEIGDAIGDFLSTVADSSAGGELFFELLLEDAQNLIRFSGEVIAWLSQTYETAYAIAEVLGMIEPQVLGKKFNEAGRDVKDFGRSAEEAEQDLKDLEAAIQSLFGQTLDVREATLRYEQSIDDLVDGLTEGKRTLDETTQAGRDNWAVINDTAQAIEDMREANVANGMSMDDARTKYGRQLEDLRRTLLSLGYNREAVNKYIDELKGIPAKAQTEVYVKGLQQALDGVRSLSGALGLGAAVGAVAGYGLSIAGAREAGGSVQQGQTYLVGEQGPELVTFGASGTVHTAAQTQQMLSGASGQAVAAGVHISVSAAPGADTALLTWLITQLRFQVDGQAGGDAQEFWGR